MTLCFELCFEFKYTRHGTGALAGYGIGILQSWHMHAKAAVFSNTYVPYRHIAYS